MSLDRKRQLRAGATVKYQARSFLKSSSGDKFWFEIGMRFATPEKAMDAVVRFAERRYYRSIKRQDIFLSRCKVFRAGVRGAAK